MKVAALLGGARQGRDEGSSTARAAPNGDGEPRKRGAAAAGRCWQQQRRRKKGSSSGDADRTNGDRVSCAGGSSDRLCWWIERAVLVDRASGCGRGKRQQQRRRGSNQRRSSERLCWWLERAAVEATSGSSGGVGSERLERAAVVEGSEAASGAWQRSDRGAGGSERIWVTLLSRRWGSGGRWCWLLRRGLDRRGSSERLC
ncbi:hypothetical protein ACOSQ2_027828 [Xanthoceras sorbifolium]